MAKIEIIKNIFWAFLEKAAKLLISLLTVVLLARYLGAEKFGTYSYVLAIVNMVGVISGLGLAGVIVKELLVKKINPAAIVGTSLILRLLTSVLLYFCIVITVYIIYESDAAEFWLFLILGLVLVGKTGEVFRSWHESIVNIKPLSVTVLVAMTFGLLLKYLFIDSSYALNAISAITAFEFFVIFITEIYIYRKSKFGMRFVFSFAVAKTLLARSWPLIISGSLWMLYTKIDLMIVGYILSPSDVAYYALSTTITDAITVFPVAVLLIMIPGVTKKISSKVNYNKSMRLICELGFWITFIFAFLLSISSSLWLLLLFGNEYVDAVNVVNVYLWASILFVFAFITGRHLININKQKLNVWRHLVGVLINVPLSYVLVQRIGLVGAAYGTLISLFISVVLLDLFAKDTRDILLLKFQALVPVILIKCVLNSSKKSE